MLNILITNDDGVGSKGIIALADVLSKKHNVYIVAPSKQMSCMSHAIKFLSGVKYKEVKNDKHNTYACEGTPADCVMFGLKVIHQNIKFDLVISGINDVLNLGSDYIYSGTVAAAQEATMLKHKGIAISVNENNNISYEEIAEIILKNLEKLVTFCDTETTLNINFPSVKVSELKGIKVCEIARREYDEIFKVLPNGKQISVGQPKIRNDKNLNTDEIMLYKNYVAVTPIKIIFNDKDKIEEMSKVEFEL